MPITGCSRLHCPPEPPRSTSGALDDEGKNEAVSSCERRKQEGAMGEALGAEA
jgi:hypothetical protein